MPLSQKGLCSSTLDAAYSSNWQAAPPWVSLTTVVSLAAAAPHRSLQKQLHCACNCHPLCKHALTRQPIPCRPCLTYAASTSTQTDQPPPLSATDELLLSFSLCNAEALHSYSTWDFGAFERRYLQPLATALSPAVRLSVESEVS